MIPVLAIVTLGVVIVAASGWGALWVYGFAVLFVAALVVLGGKGGALIEGWSRGRFRR